MTTTRSRTTSPLKRGARLRAPKVGGDRFIKAWDRLLLPGVSIGGVHAMGPIPRVDLVKQGAPPAALTVLAHTMGISREQLYKTLGVPRATMERKLRERKRLSQDESERVVGLARLIGQVEEMVRESGDSKGFNAAHWVATWLDRPLPALGGTRPATLMDTAEGRETVFNLAAQIQSGAYA